MYRKSIFVLVIVLFSFVLFAQERSQPQKNQNDKGYTLSVETLEVQLPISVLDREGRPVNGLTKDNFQIFEDKVPQTIKSFKHEDIPLSLGLIIDNSGSMRNKRERVNSAALAFVRESNPDDETFIVNFDDSAYLEQDFTGSIGGLIEENDQRGGLFKKAPSKKAKEDLQKFAEITGGQAFFPKNIDEVEELVKHIAHDLRNHYTISYTPTNAKLDGTYREVAVKVNPPKNSGKITWHTKQGYYAPKAEPVSSNQ